MQQTEPRRTALQRCERADRRIATERKRVEQVVETLATLRSEGESLAEVAHDARNMVTALGLYCDLLEEPGVLAAPYAHYGHELRLRGRSQPAPGGKAGGARCPRGLVAGHRAFPHGATPGDGP